MDIKQTPRSRTYKRLIIVFVVVMTAFSIIPVCNYFRGQTKGYENFYHIMVVFNLLLNAPHPSRERNVMVIWFVACTLLLSFMLPIPGFVTFKMMGCTFWACVLLLVGLGWKLQRLKRYFMNFRSYA